MFNYSSDKSKCPTQGLGFIILLVIILPITILNAKEKWSLRTSLSYSSGKYIYDSRVDNYTLYLGGRYSKDKLSIAMTIPFVMQRDKLNSQSESSDDSSPIDNKYSFTSGISNIYLYSEYNIHSLFYLTGQIKVPTSIESSLFTSGKFDYSLGLAFRKMFGTYKIFADGGYNILGDPDQFSYNNPFVYGFGVAKHAQNGKSSVSFYYQEYGNIITGLDPPRQLSVGYFRLLTDKLGVSFYGSAGFGESSPDYTFSLGIDVTL